MWIKKCSQMDYYYICIIFHIGKLTKTDKNSKNDALYHKWETKKILKLCRRQHLTLNTAAYYDIKTIKCIHKHMLDVITSISVTYPINIS